MPTFAEIHADAERTRRKVYGVSSFALGIGEANHKARNSSCDEKVIREPYQRPQSNKQVRDELFKQEKKERAAQLAAISEKAGPNFAKMCEDENVNIAGMLPEPQHCDPMIALVMFAENFGISTD